MNTRIHPGVANGKAGRLGIIIVMTFVLFACQPTPDTFRPPNQSELEAFSKDQGITPIEDILIGESVVLLYEKGTSFGYYALSVREPDGEMVIIRVSSPKSSDPILVMGQLSGEYPFVAVIIQDPILLAETATIEVAVPSQFSLTISTNGRASAILVSPSLVNGWGAVTLYNVQGAVLYTQEG